MLKFNNKIAATLALLFTISSCGAMKYQIKYLNTPAIIINQKQLTNGDWFGDDAVINWEKDSQAMRVLSEDNKVYTLSAKSYKESKAKKFSDFIAFTKPMASRGMHTLKRDLQALFENEYEILDEILFDLSHVKDLPAGITFLISCKNDAVSPLSLSPENKRLVIKREDIGNFPSRDGTVTLTVKFLLPDSDEEHLITRRLELIALQQELQ